MKQTAVEFIESEIKMSDGVLTKGHLLLIIEQAKEMEKKQSHQYAEFAIRCDRKDMKILNFEDWIKL